MYSGILWGKADAVLALLEDMNFGGDAVAATSGEEGEAVFGGDAGVFCSVEEECGGSVFGDVAFIGERGELFGGGIWSEEISGRATVGEVGREADDWVAEDSEAGA